MSLFFPQLVAGQIERAANLLPQFTSARPLTKQGLEMGTLVGSLGHVQKSGDRRQSRPFSQYGLFRSFRKRSGDFSGDCGFWFSNLLRLFGIFGHCARGDFLVGLPVDVELQLAVLCGDSERFLEAVAHKSFFLVSRQRLHSFGRQPMFHPQKQLKSSGNDAVNRHLARRGMELHSLGALARRDAVDLQKV